MLKLFFITIFFNIKFVETFKFLIFFIETLFLIFTILKINRLITNRFNIINDFLIDIENYDIIILSKFNPNDELIRINTL